MLLKLENIKKEYKISKSNKQIILNDINLELSSGEFVCIYGESGSGKSTLMNIIGGLDNNYDGKVKIDDVSIKELDLDKKENIPDTSVQKNDTGVDRKSKVNRMR